MEENERKIEWAGELREYFSATVSSAAFSWVVFLHAEVMGMILMSMMRRRLRAEAIEEGMARAREEVRKAALEAAREAQAEAREAQAAAREAQAEAKETQAEARRRRRRRG